MTNATLFYQLDTGTANNFFSGIWALTRCMKAAGWVYKGSSNGTSKDATGTASNDKWGGNASPLLDSYPTALSSVAAWWCASGPNVIKISITSAATGTFTRGESVTQTSSGATGELVGYVFDATNGGWVIIMPRTGTFDSTHVITGNSSGATVTSTGVKTYTQEVVFCKDTSVLNGNIYWIMADASAESSALFSTRVSVSAVTATVAPGQGGTSNTFPTQAICILGEGGVTSGPSTWASTGTATAHCLVSAVNATPGSGVSADGTAWVMFSDTSEVNLQSIVLGIFRLDDTEQGDVAPFEWLCPTGSSFASYNRTTNAGLGTTVPWGSFGISSTYVFQGYIARGVGSGAGTVPDVANYHKVIVLHDSVTGSPYHVSNTTSQVRVQNHPATTKPLTEETISLYNDSQTTTSALQQQLKGRIRWMRWCSIGNVFETTDNATWVCWLAQVTNTNPAVFIGPWDGATQPSS
jgi:hypothetical protein